MRWTDEQRFRLVCAALEGAAGVHATSDGAIRIDELADAAVRIADATLAKLADDVLDGQEWVTPDAAGAALAADRTGS